MKRKAEKLLLELKLKSDKKPLPLKGVRQCGKTYILREFGEYNYEDVAYLTLKKMKLSANERSFIASFRVIPAGLQIAARKPIF